MAIIDTHKNEVVHIDLWPLIITEVDLNVHEAHVRRMFNSGVVASAKMGSGYTVTVWGRKGCQDRYNR